MASNSDVVWSKDVYTLREAVSSRTVPIIVKVVGGSYNALESESWSQGDVVKLDTASENVISGSCYDVSQDGSVPNKQFSFNKDIADHIDVVICLNKPDNMIPSLQKGSSQETKTHAYVEFSLPIPAPRISLSVPGSPPPVPPRVKTKTELQDEDRKPMPPPRKPSQSIEQDLEAMDLDMPRLPLSVPKNIKNPIPKEEREIEEIGPNEVYEIPDEQPDNIYDEPDNIDVAKASSPLKTKTFDLSTTKSNIKDMIMKLKSKITSRMRKQKPETDVEDGEEEDDYEIPEGAKKPNIKLNRGESTRYETLESRLQHDKSPDNAYTPLDVAGGTVQTHFTSLSVVQLADRLVTCGLNDVAEVCRKERVDGRLFSTFKDDDLREIFLVNELQIRKIHMAQEHDWMPKT